jgi:hypothetical protein
MLVEEKFGGLYTAGLMRFPGTYLDGDDEGGNLNPNDGEIIDNGGGDESFRQKLDERRNADPRLNDDNNPNPNADDEDIDDAKLAKILAKRGITDPLDKIKSERGQLSKLTPKHQEAMRALKALRNELGDDYESILGRALSKQVGDESSAGFNFGNTKEPNIFKQMPEDQRTNFVEASTYMISQAFPKMLQQAMPSIVDAVQTYLDQVKFKDENPDFEEHQELMKDLAAEYGITKFSGKSLKLLQRLIKEEAEEGLKDLAGNEDKITRRTRTVPRPGNNDRQGKGPSKLVTDADFQAEFERRKAAKKG